MSRSWGAETAVCGLVALMRSRSISRLYTCYAPEAAGSVQRVQGRVAPFCSPRCFHLSSLFSPPFFRLPSLLPFSPPFSCSVLALRLPPSLLRRGPSNPLSSPEYRRILYSLVSSPVPSLLAFPPLSLLSRSRVDPYSTALSRGEGKGAVDKGSNCSEEEQARLPKLVHTVSISRNATVLHALAQGERLSVERLSVCPLRCMQCH